MKVVRAHSYDAISELRQAQSSLPEAWLDTLRTWGLIVLPDDLRPTWIGLTRRDTDGGSDAAWGGRTWDNVGGWCAGEEHSYWVRDTPHVYLNHSSVGRAIIHESLHALADLWHVDENALYRPQAALYAYMATTPAEYFACGLEAFLTPDREDEVRKNGRRARVYNRLDLAKADPNLYAYLSSIPR